jgi:hypothetical protein
VRCAAALVVACAGALCGGRAARAQTLPAGDTVRRSAWRLGLGALGARALGTMGDYLTGGVGLAVTVQREPRHGLTPRADAELVRFSSRTVRRHYEGSTAPIDITTGSTLLLVAAGLEAGLRSGRAGVGVRIGVGGAAFSNRGSTSGLDSSFQTVRAVTFSTLTWAAQAGLAMGLRLGVRPSAPRLEASALVVAAGRTAFLREYNLSIGIISGLYPQPTPYAPWLGVVSLVVTVPA